MDTNPVETPEGSLAQPIGEIKRKTKYTGTVVKTTLAGAVIDIGLETPGVVHISQLQAEPVNRVEDIIHPGQTVEVWVHRVVPKKNRIELTMIKPLDFDWRDLEKDLVVKGKVTRLEKFGAFVDIGAERPGLVHISEMTYDYIKDPSEVVKEGDEVEVKVLAVNRQKRQIKLSMKALEEPPVKEVKETRVCQACRTATRPGGSRRAERRTGADRYGICLAGSDGALEREARLPSPANEASAKAKALPMSWSRSFPGRCTRR